MNGFNPELFKEHDSDLPYSFESLGVNALFLNNCNVMLGMILAVAFLAGILYMLSRAITSMSSTLGSISKRLIKEGVLTLVMFSAFNIGFGVGTHFEYADPTS